MKITHQISGELSWAWCAAVSNIFALIDCNSFYCSCEQVFKPALKNKPIVVLSNNDGCAIARTPQAKALGIKMGTPEFMIRNNPSLKSTIIFSSNYTLYGDMSYRVQQVVKEFVSRFEIYSIDELFLLLNDYRDAGAENHARIIRQAVLDWTGIPTGVGLGPTKTLAKIANYIAKNTPDSGGVYSLMDDKVRKLVLDHFPIEEIWGIGKASKAKLMSMGVQYAGQLRDMSAKHARQYGTVVAERMIYELRGISCIPLEEIPPIRKGTAVTRSFGRPVTEFEEIAQAISTHAARGAEKLRQHGVIAGRLRVFMHTNPYRNTPQFHNVKQCSLSPYTQDTREIITASVKLAKEAFKEGIEFGKCGIILEDLRPEDEKPLDLFEAESQKSEALMKTLDKLNQKHGRHTLQFAGMGIQKKWLQRSGNKSPSYTTRLEEVPKVLAK
jgi:DNA polymerase V